MVLSFRFDRLGRFRRISALTAALLLLSSAAAFAQDKIQRWHDSLERGVDAARKSGKPLFVVFRCVR